MEQGQPSSWWGQNGDQRLLFGSGQQAWRYRAALYTSSKLSNSLLASSALLEKRLKKVSDTGEMISSSMGILCHSLVPKQNWQQTQTISMSGVASGTC